MTARARTKTAPPAAADAKPARRRRRVPKADGPPAVPDIPTVVLPIGEVKIDRRNVNKHPERNLAAIETSLRRFGQVKPIVTDRNRVVVAGNGTLEVARDRLGMTHIAVVVFPGTRAEARAYAIADNRTAELSEWDLPGLVAQLDALNADLRGAAGFDDVETDDLRAAAAKLAGSQYGPPEFPGQLPQAGLNTLGARYAKKATRTLFFEYRNDVFAWLVDGLSAFREKHELESNADAIVAMVATVTGTEPPPPDDE